MGPGQSAPDEEDTPASQDDPFPEWGFNEIDPEIETAPGTIEIDGQEFPYDSYGRATPGGEVFIDSSTADDAAFHALGISDSDQNVVRLAAPLFGGNNNVTFDLSGDGDGDPVAPGSYVVINAIGEEDPRAFQPLCVRAYEGTITQAISGPAPTVTVSTSALVDGPPAIEDPQLVVWSDSQSEQRVEMTQTGEGTFEATLSGFAPGQYSLHALLRDGTGENAQVVGLSKPDTVEVVAQSGLTFSVDGQADAVTVDDGQTVPFTATAAFEDGSEQDVTDEVSVTVANGDSAAVGINESAAEVTGTASGTATLEADDGQFTDSVEVTVEAVLTALELRIDGQLGSVTVEEGETVPYSATAVFSDGETDVTGEADVTSEDTTVVSVDQSAAQVTAEGTGQVEVSAGYETETDAVAVTVPTGEGVTVTLPDEAVPPAGEATFAIVGSSIEQLTVESLWTDWAVSATDPDGAEASDDVADEGTFTLTWPEQQASVAPTIAVTPPERYVAGEFELTATGVAGDDTTAGETAVLTIDGSL
jgi:alpha-acetolactate decarboxylase